MNDLGKRNISALAFELGFAVLVAWRPMVSRSMIATFGTQLFGSCGLLVASIVLALAASKRPEVMRHPAIAYIAAAFMFATPLCGTVLAESEGVCLAAVFLGEIGRGYYLIRWMKHYSSFDLKSAGKYILFSFALGNFMALLFIPSSVAGVLLVLVISLLSLALPRLTETVEKREKPRVTVARGESVRKTKLVLGEICILVFMLVLLQEFEGSVRYSTAAATVLGGVLKLLLPIVAIPLFMNPKKPKRMALLVQYIILIAAIMLLGLAFLGKGGIIVVTTLITLARESLQILLLLYIVNQARVAKRPFFDIGASYGIYIGTIVLGSVLSELFPGLADPLRDVSEDILLNATFFVALSVILLIVATIIRTLRTYRLDAALNDPAESVAVKIAALGKSANLTKREIEIAEYLYKGRSTSYIAETLVISANTVRFHCKHLYEKLGIHSKQELITIIDSL